MKEDLDARCRQKLVEHDLVGRDIVGLRVDSIAEERMRLCEPAKRAQAIEDLVRHAVHNLPVLAAEVRVQPAEVGEAGGGASSTEKPVALQKNRRATGSRSRDRCGNARRPAAEHDDFVLAVQRRAAGFFLDELRHGFGPARFAS